MDELEQNKDKIFWTWSKILIFSQRKNVFRKNIFFKNFKISTSNSKHFPPSKYFSSPSVTPVTISVSGQIGLTIYNYIINSFFLIPYQVCTRLGALVWRPSIGAERNISRLWRCFRVISDPQSMQGSHANVWVSTRHLDDHSGSFWAVQSHSLYNQDVASRTKVGASAHERVQIWYMGIQRPVYGNPACFSATNLKKKNVEKKVFLKNENFDFFDHLE